MTEKQKHLIQILDNQVITQVKTFVWLTLALKATSQPIQQVLNDLDNQEFMISSAIALDTIPKYLADHLESIFIRNKWTDLTVDELEKKLDSFQIMCDDKVFDRKNYTELNQFLRQRGSSLTIQWGHHGEEMEMLLGYATLNHFNQISVYEMEDEVIFTPNLRLPMAAMINKFDIIVRHRSIDGVTAIKWEPLKDLPSLFMSFIQDNPFDISYAIKTKVMDLYKHNIDALKIDLKQNILYHELGHSVIQYHQLPRVTAAIAESFQIFSMNSIITCLEICADFAPLISEKQGVLSYIANQWEENPRIISSLWLYTSDVWFFDTEDTDLYDYSECMCVLMSRYLFSSSLEQNQQNLMHDTSHDSTSVVSVLSLFIEEAITEFSHQFFTSDQKSKIQKNDLSYNEILLLSESFMKQLKVNKEHEMTDFLNKKSQQLIKCIYDNFFPELNWTPDKYKRREHLFKLFKNYFCQKL